MNRNRLTILMIGWEYPPFNSGGLGVACQGIAEAVARKGCKVHFLLPSRGEFESPGVNFIFASVDGSPRELASFSYNSGNKYDLSEPCWFGQDDSLVGKVLQYASRALEAIGENFDVICAHDWLTFPAALKISRGLEKPLVLQVHASEYERAGGQKGNPLVHKIEKEALSKADVCVAVSDHTKRFLTNHYHLPSSKVKTVYNGIDPQRLNSEGLTLENFKRRHSKIALYVGRLSFHKGGDWFLNAARRVLDYAPEVTFIIAGEGEMKGQLLEQAGDLGILDSLYFTGFLQPGNLKQVYKAADVYVLPSVSEPFGITCLEALQVQTPTIVSRQSGVSEVVDHTLKVDFWDTERMANLILGVLNHKPLQEEMSTNGAEEVSKLTWDQAANELLDIYRRVEADRRG